MTPYIVKTFEEREHYERRRAVEPGAYWNERTTERAVATLEEAQDIVRERIDATAPRKVDEAWTINVAAFAALDESALAQHCTVGPLPDGTMMEVRRVGRLERARFTLQALLSSRATDQEWCDAYNARRSS